jgi:hypothetical protein
MKPFGGDPKRLRISTRREDRLERELHAQANDGEITAVVISPVIGAISKDGQAIDFRKAKLKAGASDVHLECTSGGLTVKYRIDGVLTNAQSVAGVEFAEQVISRIKVMSELDIAERRVPQDGRFKARRDGRDIDFRVSVVARVYVEVAVLRILVRRALAVQREGLARVAGGCGASFRCRRQADRRRSTSAPRSRNRRPPRPLRAAADASRRYARAENRSSPPPPAGSDRQRMLRLARERMA